MVPVRTPRGLASPYRATALPDGRRALRKRVKPHQELFSPPAVAVDETVLISAERDGLAGIMVDRLRTGQTFWAALNRWRHGIRVRRGYGPQRALRWEDLDPLPDAAVQMRLL